MSWKIEKIQALLTDQVEENIHLDYKAADALSLTEGKKNDISLFDYQKSTGATVPRQTTQYI